MSRPAGMGEAGGTLITNSTFSFNQPKNSWLPPKVTGTTYGDYNPDADIF